MTFTPLEWVVLGLIGVLVLAFLLGVAIDRNGPPDDDDWSAP